MKRRKFVKGMAAITALGAATGMYAWQVEPFWLEFVHQKMPVKNLPKHLEGKMVMQISDIHVGNRFDWGYIIDSFKKAQALKPDFVVYTGDFVHYEDATQYKDLKTVMKHVVTGNIGTYGVLGNHDYGHDWEQPEVADTVSEILEESGIRILRNEQEEKEGLHIIGIDDYWGTNFQPEALLQKHNANHANIALCHNPDVCDLSVWNGYKSWILSGHTHGGQVKPPFLPSPMLPVKNKKYSSGKIPLEDGRTLYINRALGCLWQVRFNMRPEITVFHLEQAV
ncbi:metallophosphoesterase [Ascidiimonas sp. W6]|uniref:metallophosphoesterase n=1 Tax=Ascidiimonas meishanensis TaxID=3128903 RepID=UPI0030EF271D